MDVVVTEDDRVLVSSEYGISLQACLPDEESRADGVGKKEKGERAIYKTSYAQIRSLPCDEIALRKPLLEDVIVAVENHIKGYTAYEVDYFIEIKSSKSTEEKFHPSPIVYSDLVYGVVDQYLPLDRLVIGSADFRVLQYWRKKYPDVRLCALISNSKSVASNLKELGFAPSIYGLNYKFLKQSQVQELHGRKIRIIPWPVNEIGDMKKVKEWGVDGFITSYPQRASNLGFGLKFNTTEQKAVGR